MENATMKCLPAGSLSHGLRLGLSLLMVLAVAKTAQALTHDGSDGKPSSLFISVLDPNTNTSYYRDLDTTHQQFLDNPALTLDLSGDSQYSGFVGKTNLLYNIAAFQKLAPDSGNLASWGYLLTTTGTRKDFAGDFVSIDAVRQRMQIYAGYLTGTSGLSKPGDDSYFDGEHWGPTLGGVVGSNTAGTIGQALPFFLVNNNTGDLPGARVALLGNWLLSREGKLVFARSASTNLPPVAKALSAATAALGDKIALDGSGSDDPDHGPEALRIAWNKLSGPLANIEDSQSPAASFTPTSVGTYVFRLSVGDGEASATATTTVAVLNAINQPPIAKTVPKQSVVLGQSVVLDGSESSDPDRLPSPLGYHWSQTSGPVNVVLTGAETSRASFTAAQTGTYRFVLEVSDGALTAKAETEVLVTPPKTITLNAPTTWKVRSKEAIRWVTYNVKPKRPVKILFARNGTRFKILAISTVRKGYYFWRPTRAKATSNGTLRACVKPLARSPWECDDLKVEVLP
ncbi:MAG: hypothetical protein LUO80_05105 [Methylococcaceae bacterium]|nr:hypothetical protein [Methylococcaceae bacterium]